MKDHPEFDWGQFDADQDEVMYPPDSYGESQRRRDVEAQTQAQAQVVDRDLPLDNNDANKEKENEGIVSVPPPCVTNIPIPIPTNVAQVPPTHTHTHTHELIIPVSTPAITAHCRCFGGGLDRWPGERDPKKARPMRDEEGVTGGDESTLQRGGLAGTGVLPGPLRRDGGGVTGRGECKIVLSSNSVPSTN